MRKLLLLLAIGCGSHDDPKPPPPKPARVLPPLPPARPIPHPANVETTPISVERALAIANQIPLVRINPVKVTIDGTVTNKLLGGKIPVDAPDGPCKIAMHLEYLGSKVELGAMTATTAAANVDAVIQASPTVDAGPHTLAFVADVEEVHECKACPPDANCKTCEPTLTFRSVHPMPVTYQPPLAPEVGHRYEVRLDLTAVPARFVPDGACEH
jgi:hypothetical protein